MGETTGIALQLDGTVHARCMRCGDWHSHDPFEMYGWGLCNRCWSRHPDLYPFPWRFHRWMDRWQKCGEKHPTWRALVAAQAAEVRS